MASGSLKMTLEAAGTRPIIFSIKGYPCMPKAASSCGGPPVASRPTKPLVSKNGLGRLQNDLGGCWRVLGPGLSFLASKVTPVCPKQGAIPYTTLPAIPDKHANGLGRPQNDLGGCRDQAYHFQHQARSHSIQGMAGHS